MEARILIVDDEPAIQRLLARYLEEEGYECHIAENVASAKRLLDSMPFDLLLSDLVMPGDSGVELIRHAKEHYPHIGRVMITAYGSPGIASDIIAIGVYGYVVKPVTKDIVLITVQNALRLQRLDCNNQAYKVEMEKKIFQRTEKLTAIMDNIDIGVVMIDTEMRVVELNKKMQQLFPNISVGNKTHCYQVFNISQGQSICENCPMVTTFESGEVCETMRSVITEGGERELRVVTSPIFDESGNIYAGIGLYEDVTEKMIQERDLRQAQKFEAVGQLAAGIAHEINSPVQYIGDNVSFLKDSFDEIAQVMKTYGLLWQGLTDKGVVPEEFAKKLENEMEAADIEYLLEETPRAFEQSLEGVARVEKIVRAMKHFSHPGSDEKTGASINAILENTITVCRNEWKYVAEVETDFAADLPVVPCFVSEISQAFLNIIVNGAHAISAFTNGGRNGMGKISIKTTKAENNVQIRISDTGGGVPEEIQDQIFDPFFTTKALGEGTGQGLAIARRVVDSHQGNLFFKARKNEGTTFVIELPLVTTE
jgi:signal transduction histidine kinase/DNA-binding response OmpR family regulator